MSEWGKNNDIIEPKWSSNTEKEKKENIYRYDKKDKKNNASKNKSWFPVHFALFGEGLLGVSISTVFS